MRKLFCDLCQTEIKTSGFNLSELSPLLDVRLLFYNKGAYGSRHFDICYDCGKELIERIIKEKELSI